MIVKSQWYVSNGMEFTERYLKLNSIHSFTLTVYFVLLNVEDDT